MDFFDIAHPTTVSPFSFCWLRPNHHVQFDVFVCPPTFALKSAIAIMYVWMVLFLVFILVKIHVRDQPEQPRFEPEYKRNQPEDTREQPEEIFFHI